MFEELISQFNSVSKTLRHMPNKKMERLPCFHKTDKCTSLLVDKFY